MMLDSIFVGIMSTICCCFDTLFVIVCLGVYDVNVYHKEKKICDALIIVGMATC